MTRSDTAEHYHPWTTYIYAREEARRRGERRVGTEYVVLGLLHDPAIESALGIRLEAAREALDALDREALGSIDLNAALKVPFLAMREAPARPTVRAVLTDRLPLTPAAKRALQDAGKPMRRGRHITPQEVLLKILAQEPPDPAAVLFAELGIDRRETRARLLRPPAAA